MADGWRKDGARGGPDGRLSDAAERAPAQVSAGDQYRSGEGVEAWRIETSAWRSKR